MLRSKIVLLLAVLVATCSISCGATHVVRPLVVLPSGLRYIDWAIGSGAVADTGAIVTIDYEIWLENGTKIVSSYDRRSPLQFTLGVGQVIAGFDEGILGMHAGGIRSLFIPAKLAYGDRGVGPIPPNSGLKANVHLISAHH